MIEKITYKLKLPENWKKLDKIFHVGLLKKYVFDPYHILSDLLKIALKGEFIVDPDKILKLKNQCLKNKTFSRFYVK